MEGATVVQIVAGVLAAAVLGIIVYRRKQKAVVVNGSALADRFLCSE